jgi:hypothetical protein
MGRKCRRPVAFQPAACGPVWALRLRLRLRGGTNLQCAYEGEFDVWRQ